MTEQKKKPPSQIPLKYVKSEDYKILPVTGAVGGPTPKGEILVSFTLDYAEFPESAALTEVPGKSGQYQEPQIENLGFVRQLQMAAILSPEHAVTIGDWLAEHGRTVIKSRGTSDA